MKKFNLILILVFIWTDLSAVTAQIPSTRGTGVPLSYRSREELMEVLNFHYPTGNSLRGEIPMTRREYAAIMSDYLDDLIRAAMWKLKIKNEAEYFELVRSNSSFAVSNERSDTKFSDPSLKKFRDVNLPGLEMRRFNRLSKLGVDVCDADLLCYPEQKVSEREFYQWLQKIFGVSLTNPPTSDQPLIRARMVNSLGDALWASYRKINGFTPVSPNATSAQPPPAPSVSEPKKKGYTESRIVKLGVPKYPAEARKLNLHDRVEVGVTIDEAGNVVSAKAITGNPVFHPAAEAAAMESKFTPAYLDGKPVRVNGKVVYNF